MSLADRIAESSARLQGLPGFPVIETDRLWLRPPEEDDLDAVFRLFSHPRVMRYWSRLPMQDRSEAQAYIDNNRQGFADRQFISWIVAGKPAGEMIGTCTLYDVQLKHLRCGIGYALLPEHHGRGYAREAVTVACAWAFEFLGLHRLEAEIHPDNTPSRQVLEHCGFRSEGLLRERFILAEEIQASEIFGRLVSD